MVDESGIAEQSSGMQNSYSERLLNIEITASAG